jgi:hypothetical protein
MTDKNNEELLNIYDDQSTDDLFATNDESKKEVSANETAFTLDDADINTSESDIADNNDINIVDNTIENNKEEELVEKEDSSVIDS